MKDGGSRKDENLVQAFQKIKEEERASYRFVEDKQALNKWANDENAGLTDYVLGKIKLYFSCLPLIILYDA